MEKPDVAHMQLDDIRFSIQNFKDPDGKKTQFNEIPNDVLDVLALRKL